MRILIEKNYEKMSRRAAQIIASQVTMQPESVLGLATGSTPVGMYKNLVEMFRMGELSFKNVSSFNLDEYIGLNHKHPQSYKAFMDSQLFDHVDIGADQVHIPCGMAEDVNMECLAYEKAIESLGGIDLQVLGIGHNGHIGFNEPGSSFEARTHMVDLDAVTIQANARFFDDVDQVPRQAISMGIKTIMKSRKVMLLASGKDKAEIIQKMVHGPITPSVPASILQLHQDLILVLDEEAASLLAGGEGLYDTA